MITDDSNSIVFPKAVPMTYGYYKLVGYNSMSPSIAFVDLSNPMYATEGMELRIWYGEDLANWSEVDNVGTACVDVYAKFS